MPKSKIPTKLKIVKQTKEQREARFKAIKMAIEHADAVTSHWAIIAKAHLDDLLCVHADKFKCSDFRAWATENGCPAPPDPRAWGGIMMGASRKGLIQKAGRDWSEHNYVYLWERAEVDNNADK